MSESNDRFFDNKLFSLNKKYLCAIGRWPYQDRKIKIFMPIFLCTCVATTVVPEVIYLVEVYKEVNKLIDCIPALFITYAAYVLLLFNVKKSKVMVELLEKIKSSWMSIRDEGEHAILEAHAKKGRFLVILYTMAILGTFTIFIIVPLLPKILDKIFPLNESRHCTNLLEVQYYVDPDKYYVPIFLHGLQAAIIVIAIIFSIDTYYVMICQHACGMFVLLGYRFNKITECNRKEFNKYTKISNNQQICEKIVDCIKYHRECIRYVELIEESFYIAWFMQLFLNMLIISICGVQTISRAGEPILMLKFGLNTFCTSFRLLFVSYPGQMILNHSSQVREFIVHGEGLLTNFTHKSRIKVTLLLTINKQALNNPRSNIKWYEFSLDAKKLLLFMLLRSSRPSQITAGKMVYLNFETYCTLMQTSMSYFTMILSTQ